MLLCVAGVAALFVHATQPAWWLRLWYPLNYRSAVVGYARQDKLDPALLAAVIYRESRFRPDARSDAGAVGLMQLLPDTAQGIAIHTGGTRFDPATDLLNPDLNIRYGAWYLRHLMNHYAAYPNSRRPGPGRLQRRPVQRRLVDRGHSPGTAGADPLRGDPRLRRAVRHLQDVYRKAYGAAGG